MNLRAAVERVAQGRLDSDALEPLYPRGWLNRAEAFRRGRAKPRDYLVMAFAEEVRAYERGEPIRGPARSPEEAAVRMTA